tara:strand:+ start:497 stop:784 length:288 start_codon:yes stop_codon:yes gene_type:complete
MKKIKLSVAALTIAMMSYGQETKKCCVKTVQSVYDYEGLVMEQEKLKTVHYLLEELNDAVRMDLYYNRIDEQNGAYYLEQILTLQRMVPQIITTK